MKKLILIMMTALAAICAKGQEVTLEITNAEWATYMAPGGINFNQLPDIAVFKVSEVKATSVVLSRVQWAGQGDVVLVNGAEGIYHLTTDATIPHLEGNLLHGSEEEVTSDGSLYGLKEIYKQVAFYHVLPGNTIPARKGYLVVSNGNESGYALELDAEGVEEVSTQQPDNTIFYNLQGIRVSRPTHGVYIVNGKKVVVR